MTITIPQKLTRGKELVVLPLDEYENLLELRKIYEFSPSKEQKKSLITARKNRKAGVTLNLSELKNKLGLAD